MPQKLGEPIRQSRAGPEVLRDVVFVRWSESAWNSVLPVINLRDAQAPKTLWKRLNRDVEDAMPYYT